MYTMTSSVIFGLLLTACGDKADDSAPSEESRWYSTCGDPECSGYSGPTEGLELCTDQLAGADCDPDSAMCDLETACNTRMLCATEDPKASEYGCPQSRSAVKTDIRYLDPSAAEHARQQVLSTRLATYRYRWEAPGHKPHLGFLIDDQPGSAAVAADGAHVDLYGYTSLTVAAVQAQEIEIRALSAALEETRSEMATLRSELQSLRVAPRP